MEINNFNQRYVGDWIEQDYDNFVRSNTLLFHIFVRRFIKDESLGEDIVQDALFKLWRDRKKIGHVLDAKNYVFVMIKNIAFNHIKREKRVVSIEEQRSQDYGQDDFFNDLISAETLNILFVAINSLVSDHQLIMKMSLEGKTNDEIANEIGLTIDSVKSIKKRIMAKLRTKFNADLLFLLFYL